MDGDRPATTEIEITDAMIRAGEAALAGFSEDYATIREGAEIILKAALRAGGFVTES